MSPLQYTALSLVSFSRRRRKCWWEFWRPALRYWGEGEA